MLCKKGMQRGDRRVRRTSEVRRTRRPQRILHPRHIWRRISICARFEARGVNRAAAHGVYGMCFARGPNCDRQEEGLWLSNWHSQSTG